MLLKNAGAKRIKIIPLMGGSFLEMSGTRFEGCLALFCHMSSCKRLDGIATSASTINGKI